MNSVLAGGRACTINEDREVGMLWSRCSREGERDGKIEGSGDGVISGYEVIGDGGGIDVTERRWNLRGWGK